jgi:hypothetical protein
MRLTHDAVPTRNDGDAPPSPAARGTVSVVVPAGARDFGLDRLVEHLSGTLHEIILLGEAKGEEIAAGLAAATGEHVLVVDPDHSVEPAGVSSFLDALEAGCAKARAGGVFETPIGRASACRP